LNKITDVKSALKEGNQQKKLCKGAIFKKFLAGGNAKHVHLAAGKDLLGKLRLSLKHFHDFFLSSTFKV
jgi:hypothetical protein